jgi:hypothetical protein
MRPAPGGEPGEARDPDPDRDRDRDRDRDAAGRARNARPRDGLGRPLERGAAGEPTIPDGVALRPQDALEAAQRLLDEGRPFHAHEVLEASWKTAPPAERDLWQGLAQLAVGLTHALRGNAGGAVTLLRRGADRVGRYQPAEPRGASHHGTSHHGTSHHGIDAAGLAVAATGLAARIDEHGLSGLTASDLRLQLRRAL